MSFGNGSIDLTSRANGERFNLIFREIVVAFTVPGLDFAQPIQRPRAPLFLFKLSQLLETREGDNHRLRFAVRFDDDGIVRDLDGAHDGALALFDFIGGHCLEDHEDDLSLNMVQYIG